MNCGDAFSTHPAESLGEPRVLTEPYSFLA